MPVIVVAVIIPKHDKMQVVLNAFATVSPKVHREQGCELYAAHTDGDHVVMVERWTTQEDLDAHGLAAPVMELKMLWDGSLAKEPEILLLENVPLGDSVKGVIQ